jgi:hypothetical protein
MYAYGRTELQLYSFLTSPREGGEGSASCPNHSTPRERAPLYALNARLHSPHKQPDVFGKKNLLSLPGIKQFLNFAAHSLATVHDYVIPPP